MPKNKKEKEKDSIIDLVVIKNGIKLKSTKLELVKRQLSITRRQLKKLLNIPLIERGSLDNENIVKLRVKEDHLLKAFKRIKKVRRR